MVKRFKELTLTKNTRFNESIEVEGNIVCEEGRWNLTVKGNIAAGSIYVSNLRAQDIHARDINARYIDARNIFAENIWAIDIAARSINAELVEAWRIYYTGSVKAKYIICDRVIKSSRWAKSR